MVDLLNELRDYLDTLNITRANIGDIRRQCFMPWEGDWNGCVRDETAAREKPAQAQLAEDEEEIHTGDDARLDCITNIRASLDGIFDGQGKPECGHCADLLSSALDSCETLDALIIATIKRERSAAKVYSPASSSDDMLQEIWRVCGAIVRLDDPEVYARAKGIMTHETAGPWRCLWHGDNCDDMTCRDSGRWVNWPPHLSPVPKVL